jgi:hypothetical protein
LNSDNEPPDGADCDDDQARANYSGTNSTEARNWLASRPVTPPPPRQPEDPGEQTHGDGAERHLNAPRQPHGYTVNQTRFRE